MKNWPIYFMFAVAIVGALMIVASVAAQQRLHDDCAARTCQHGTPTYFARDGVCACVERAQ